MMMRSLRILPLVFVLLAAWQAKYIESFAPITSSSSSSPSQRTTHVRLNLNWSFNGEENSDGASSTPESFFIRAAMPSDMGRVADLLTDGFFKHKTNFFTYRWERMATYLSLESGFPKPRELHEMFVACQADTGKVLGLAEIDARTNGDGRGQNGPYMCNVAVDENCRRQGIASALIQKCEEQVQEWSTNTDMYYLSRSVHLKVRQTNEAAIAMYDRLGYRNLRVEVQDGTNDIILVLRKQLPELSSEEEEAEETLVSTSGVAVDYLANL